MSPRRTRSPWISTSLDKETVARERAILSEKHQGKPAHVIEKIVESGLKTYYKEVCLIDQAYVRDPSKTVGQAVQEFGNRTKQPLQDRGLRALRARRGDREERERFRGRGRGGGQKLISGRSPGAEAPALVPAKAGTDLQSDAISPQS